jgi:carbon-monoxide dehydrogenase medium subunit
VKPAPFKYAAPRTLDEALRLKAEHGDEAFFLAGGQSLVPAMNFRLARPRVLIDINGVAGLERIEVGADGALALGALVRQRHLEFDPVIAQHQPLVSETAPNVAHAQIRNRGTLCGSLAHADPASEMPAVMLALEARLHLQSTSSDRWVDAPDFFLGVYMTARAPDEMVVGVAIPALAPRTGTRFIEVSRRPGDFAMMGVAAVVMVDESGTCTRARLAYCGAGETPMAATKAAQSLIGGRLDEMRIGVAAALAHDEVAPTGNVHATARYQRHLAGVLTRRALQDAARRATAGLR